MGSSVYVYKGSLFYKSKRKVLRSHIKVTHPPCLFQLSPWENVNRSTTLIYVVCVMSFH